MVVDRSGRRLAHLVCLNCFHHGGSFPRKMDYGAGPACLPVSRGYGSAGLMAGSPGAGGIGEG